MKITLREWLDQFKTNLDAIQNKSKEVKEKKSNELLEDMLYVHKELLAAQTSTLLFLPHLSNAKKRSDKYFSNNELIENKIAKDETSQAVIAAYRNFANRWEDVTDKPKTANLPGAPDYAKRLASIDNFLAKLDNTPERKMNP